MTPNKFKLKQKKVENQLVDLRSLLRNKEYLKDAKRRDEKALKRRKLAKSVFIAGLDVLFVSRAGLESSWRLEIKKIQIKTSTSRIYIFLSF